MEIMNIETIIAIIISGIGGVFIKPLFDYLTTKDKNLTELEKQENAQEAEQVGNLQNILANQHAQNAQQAADIFASWRDEVKALRHQGTEQMKLHAEVVRQNTVLTYQLQEAQRQLDEVQRELKAERGINAQMSARITHLEEEIKELKAELAKANRRRN